MAFNTSKDKYSKMKLTELKAELQSKNLSSTGLKKDLAQRLRQHASNSTEPGLENDISSCTDEPNTHQNQEEQLNQMQNQQEGSSQNIEDEETEEEDQVRFLSNNPFSDPVDRVIREYVVGPIPEYEDMRPLHVKDHEAFGHVGPKAVIVRPENLDDPAQQVPPLLSSDNSEKNMAKKRPSEAPNEASRNNGHPPSQNCDLDVETSLPREVD